MPDVAGLSPGRGAASAGCVDGRARRPAVGCWYALHMLRLRPGRDGHTAEPGGGARAAGCVTGRAPRPTATPYSGGRRQQAIGSSRGARQAGAGGAAMARDATRRRVLTAAAAALPLVAAGCKG